MRSKTLELLMDTLKCEVKNCGLSQSQKESLIEDLLSAINSTEYDSHTDEDIELSIFRFLEKYGSSSGKDIAKGIGVDVQILNPYLKGLVENRTIIHNGKNSTGSQYFIDENPVLNVINARIDRLREMGKVTIKETRVLFLFTIGLSRKEISHKLGMSNKLVSSLINDIKSRLEIETDRELVWKVTVDLA